MTLEAVVPGFAAATAIFTTENLLRGGDAADAGPDGQDLSGRVTLRRTATLFAPGGSAPGMFPLGDAVVLAPGSPYAQCLADGKPVVSSRPDSQMLEQAGPECRPVFARYSSFLAVPVSVGSIAVGLLVLARTPAVPAFGGSDIADAVHLAAAAGTGLASAVARMRHQSIANALQRGLLAAEPVQPQGVEVEGRCLPAAGNLIGGDWYDLIPLPRRRTGIVVGDVMGHGPEAAAVMAQLRAAGHVLAELDIEPDEFLARLNRLTMTLRDISLTTCLYAVIDPEEHSCTLAAAGHLPPVLALLDGTVQTLSLPGGQSLGVGPAVYGQHRVELPRGSVIALYTDGLVETRNRSFDQGISALRAQLAAPYPTLKTACDDIISTLADRPEDDITLILARIPDSP